MAKTEIDIWYGCPRSNGAALPAGARMGKKTRTSRQRPFAKPAARSAALTFFQSFVCALLFAAVCLRAQPSVKHDSAAAVPKKPSAAAAAKTADEDLILDDNSAGPLLPAVTKAAPAAAPAKKVDTVSAAPAPVPGPAGNPEKTKNAAPPAARSPVVVKDTAKKVSDEELILDGGAEDLLGPAKSAFKPQAPAKTDSTASGALPSVAAPRTGQTDSSAQIGTAANQSAQPDSTAGKKPSEQAVPQIEKVRSINFAANLKDYRSPKLAMFLSLLLPGAGQVYAKKNLFAGIFVAVEAAMIGTGLSFLKKGKDKKNEARSFADKNYNPARFNAYRDYLKQYLTVKFDKKNADSIYSAIFNDMGSDTVFLADARARNDSYYDQINGADKPYIRGWNDVRPDSFNQNGFVFSPADSARFGRDTTSTWLLFLKPDTTNLCFGQSANQEHYASILADSRKWSNYARTTFVSLLLNHLASAAMAGIAAKRHNDNLLGKESLWQHIDLKEQMVNTGSEIAPGYAVAVRF